MGTQSGKRGTKDISKSYPVVSGLEGEDKHDGRQINLVPEKGSLVPRRLKGTLD